MSFWTTIKRVFTGAEQGLEVGMSIASTVDPLIGLINPGVKAIMDKVTHVVVSTESMVQTAQAGAVKKESASQILAAEIPQLQDVVGQFGKNLTIPTAELGNAIDTTVAAENAIAALVEKLKAQQKGGAAATPPAPAAPGS